MKPDKQVKNAHKTQWKKGQSGNPVGRPRKDVSLTSLAKEVMGQVAEGDSKGRTWRELLVLRWVTGSLKDVRLFQLLMERIEGRVPQPITGKDGGPIEANISLVDGLHKKAKEHKGDDGTG